MEKKKEGGFWSPKITRIMKITLVFTLLCALHISATTYAQTTHLSVDVRNGTFYDVVKQIEKQSEYLFFYDSEEVPDGLPVNISETGKVITVILDELAGKHHLSYTINNRHIFITKAKAGQQAGKKITGVVKDQTGEPLVGVNVVEKGTTNGTMTDADGVFSLTVQDNALLQISYIGYQVVEQKTSGKTRFDIRLAEDSQALDEVVVVGYGTQKKINLTGAVARITPEEVENRPITNVVQALQGVSPGLNISTSRKFGGEAGSPMEMNIRGTGSLTEGSGAPYVLVDGVPMDLSLVNPTDIENISVLKDAASAAIYGARAAYGVILVTTKKGKKGDKYTISYNTNIGWKTPTTLPRTANSVQYATAVNQSCLNSSLSPMFSDETMEKMRQYMANPGSLPGIMPEPNDPTRWGQYDQTYANTDWYDVYFKDWAFQQTHDISLNGSTDKSAFYVGLGYLDTNGQLNFCDENYKRYNVTVNNDVQLTSFLKMKLNTKFIRSDKRSPIGYGGYDRTVLYHMFSRAYPTLPVYDPNGNFTESCSVAQIMKEGGSEKVTTNSVYVTPSFELTLTDDWKVNGDFTYNYDGFKRMTHFAKVNVGEVNGKGKYLHHANNFNQVEEEQHSTSYMTGNLYTNYVKSIEKHTLSAMVGGQFEYNNYGKLLGKKRDLITDKVPAIGTATGVTTLSDEMYEWSTLGAFLRLGYTYDDKYMVEFNGRYDGSSRFRRGKRWGFFPSVSAGYTLSREKYWEPLLDYVNMMKIRASYGSLGNQEVPNYLHVETLPIKTNLNFPIGGIRPVYTQAPDLVSWNLTWEESRTVNIGADLGFLSNRLTATFDWYNRETVNMFGPSEALPAVLGKNPPKKNNASIGTKGFELTLTWKGRVNDDFNYSVTGLLSDNKTTVLKYNNPTRLLSNGKDVFYEGQSLGEIWGYETDGFFRDDADVKGSAGQSALYAKWSAGDIKYKDLNGDKKIDWGDGTADNPGDKKIIGNSTPRFLYGLNLSANYKDFDFSMFWQGVGKRDVFIGSTSYFGFQNNKFFTNVYEHNLDYWTEENTGAFFAKPYATGEVDKNQQIQSRFLQNAAYLRLKNLQIGYSLPRALLQKVKIDRLRFYVSGENLLTFTKLVDGIDPECTEGEWGDAKSYPASLVCSFGLNLTF